MKKCENEKSSFVKPFTASLSPSYIFSTMCLITLWIKAAKTIFNRHVPS